MSTPTANSGSASQMKGATTETSRVIDLGSVGQGHNGHPVAVADHQVAGADGDPGNGDWNIDRSGAGFDRAPRQNGGREDREPELGDVVPVANATLDDDAGHAPLPGAKAEQFAPGRSLLIAAGSDHDDVARAGELHGLVNHQVVPGHGLYRQRWAAQAGAREERLHSVVHAVLAVQGVAHHSGRETGECLDQLRIGAGWLPVDVVHGNLRGGVSGRAGWRSLPRRRCRRYAGPLRNRRGQTP